MSKQIVILTVGRTGSSMLAHILSEMGVFMGHIFPRADPYNPLGYWEDLEFVALSEKVLQCQMLFGALPYQTALEQLIAEREAHYSIWGWKDRQTLMTAHTWHPLLPNPIYLHSVRNLEDVVRSYVRAWKRPARELRGAVKLWQKQAQDFLADKPHLIVDYDDLLNTRDVERIAAFVGVDGDLEKARGIIQPELRTVDAT